MFRDKVVQYNFDDIEITYVETDKSPSINQTNESNICFNVNKKDTFYTNIKMPPSDIEIIIDNIFNFLYKNNH